MSTMLTMLHTDTWGGARTHDAQRVHWIPDLFFSVCVHGGLLFGSISNIDIYMISNVSLLWENKSEEQRKFLSAVGFEPAAPTRLEFLNMQTLRSHLVIYNTG